MLIKGYTLFDCTNFHTSDEFIDSLYENINKALDTNNITIKY